jgi:GTPase SAR1 family protein
MTFLGLGMDVWGLILGVIAIVIGIPAVIFVLPQLWKSMRAIGIRRRIVVLGPVSAGKTSLVAYLRKEATPRKHKRTVGAVAKGRVALDLTGDKTVYFAAKEVVDVGGEFRNQWKSAVEEYDPHGIIFVVDQHNFDLEIDGFRYLFEIYEHWSSKRLNDDIALKTILMLINKADLWATGGIAHEQQMIANYERDFAAVADKFDSLLGVNVLFGATSLLHSRYSEQTNQNLRDLASSLDAKRVES